MSSGTPYTDKLSNGEPKAAGNWDLSISEKQRGFQGFGGLVLLLVPVCPGFLVRRFLIQTWMMLG